MILALYFLSRCFLYTASLEVVNAMTTELEVELKAFIRFADELKKINQNLESKLQKTVQRNIKLIDQRNKLID